MKMSEQITKMLKKWGITQAFYEKIRGLSDMSQDEYDALAVELDAPLGKDWGTMEMEYRELDGGNTIIEKNYYQVCSWGIASAKYFLNPEEEEYFKKMESMTFKSFHSLGEPHHKEFLDRVKRQIIHIGCIEEKNLGGEILDLVDEQAKLMISKKQKDIDALKEIQSKKDFNTYWECAIYCRQQIIDGHLENHIGNSYKWGVKNCTIKGKRIPHWTKLQKGYDNGKLSAKADIVIQAFEEKNYN